MRQSAIARSSILIVALGWLTIARADTSPPVLTGFDFTPQSVDVTSGSATVTCTMQVTDSPAGATEVNARFISPISFQVAYCYGSLVSGTPQNGTWQGVATIPAFAEGGTWRAEVHQLYDAVGNFRGYSTADLQQAGYPTTLTVTSAQDITAPVLTGFSFAPQSVDVATASATVMCTMHVTDAPAGATEVNARFISPISFQAAYCYGSLVSGTPQSGTWQGTATIPAFAEGGTWRAEVHQLYDAVGNFRGYSTSDLQQAGFPTNLSVISTSDISSPTLTSFDFNPKHVDISTGSATITCTMAVTDAPAGATEVNARFISPLFHQVAYCYGSLSSGTPQSGTWQGVAAIPQYSEEGIWKAQVFQLVDAVGNTGHYDTAALQQAGFPTDLTIGFADGGPVAEIYHPRDAATVRGNSVTVAARLTQGSPASVSPSLGVRFEYRKLPSATFAPIPTSDGNHPNPDTTFPYFVHWDVSSLPVGEYALRAIAHELNGGPDPAPSVISIIIVRNNAGVDEFVNSTGLQESWTAVNNSLASTATSGDIAMSSAILKVVLPPGALAASADTARLWYVDPVTEAPKLDEPSQSTGIFVDFSLTSGQSVFQSGVLASVDIGYSDHDEDGIVDGIAIRESELELYRHDPNTDRYFLIPSVVMIAHNQVHADVSSTGRFAITGPQLPKLRFDPDKSSLTWSPVSSATAYNVYRGEVAGLLDLDHDGFPDSGYGDCRNSYDPNLGDTLFLDSDVPSAGARGFFYLVSFVVGATESGLGSTSSGFPRGPSLACP